MSLGLKRMVWLGYKLLRLQSQAFVIYSVRPNHGLHAQHSHQPTQLWLHQQQSHYQLL